ncbi:nucleotidyltransferase [Streptomyces sp. WAC 06725]|uniref:nucleotidyltransferase domain-containing protein n=1 Tax=Streptomyces sp. WAC 06725 TaxID=2203209 RepID=UPI000F74AFAD|nr:nucleotidyltransferase domain-containing protein [Streptomyces sp. WAC 06725]RSO29917.1 nucleotidyltransferase [Streptomyces sp. WAC 06725]
MKDHDSPASEALCLIHHHFPHAVGALLGGSAARGHTSTSSDLDVAVLLPDSDTSRRQVIRHNGRLAELFIHTVTGFQQALEHNRGNRRGTLLFIYDQGMPLLDPYGDLERARVQARSSLAAGPIPLTPAEWERGRYLLTCFMDDLIDVPSTNRYEQLSLADHTLLEAAHLLTAHHRVWTGIGKWLPRRLLSADPVHGQALLDGHQPVAEHADTAPLAVAAERVLDLVGGPLRERYTQR